MGLEDSDILDDCDGKASSVSCSICLEPVTDNGDRSWAKLQCGHQFHLDCIGSAFNIKGEMQCPNCRKIEKGQWLFASACRPFPEFSMDDWAHDEDLYDLSYSEMSFGVHWCPFSGLTRLPLSVDEGEFSSTAYHDLIGQHPIFAEHTAVSSSTHPCPYIAYLGPIHPSLSNSGGSVSDGSSFNNHWNGPSVPSEMPASYPFPAVDVHYHSWQHHSSPFPTSSSHVGGADQSLIPSVTQRAARPNSDIPRSGSFMHPFLVGHSSAARAGSSIASSMIPPYPGSVARARDRVQALQAYFQQPTNSPPVRMPIMSGTRRSSSHRGVTQVGPVASSSDQTGGFYFFPPASSGRNFPEAENHPMSNRFHAWEREHVASFPLSQGDRDLGWGPFHQAGGGSDTAIRSTSSRQRFQDAEDDCTEALNLDDCEIKAYSRRSTARKEPGKLKESIEDAEFAPRLEPHNQEIKKQYAETKSLHDKEILNKASGALRSSVQKVGKSKAEVNGHVGAVQSVSRSSPKMVTAAIQEDHNKDSDGQVPAKTSMFIEEIENKSMRSKGQEANASCEDGVQSSGLESSKKNHKKQELKASVQELAARAASRAMAEAAKNITPPNSAYQFEVSWRGLAGDRTLQARLLKVTSPVALPQIFKNAMSAPMLVDIIRCIATLFTEEIDLAVKYLENLAKVSRFDMIMMGLSSTDRADLHRIWDDVFCNNATPMEYAERLDKLRSRYCRKQ